MPARMRFPAQALDELSKLDPNTAVSLRMIRRLVNSGAVPSVPVGTGNRKLLNFDALLDYLESPHEEEQVQGIRRIDERACI